ncbi:MAG: hypothetical protein ACR2GT_08110 [Gaiellaceae bacterium]
MSRVTIDGATGVLRIGGAKLFPLGLSNPPPLGGTTPAGKDGLQELAEGGASFIRTGRGNWSAAQLDEQLAAERAQLDAAATHGLQCWLYLGDLPDLPARTAASGQASVREQTLSRIAAVFRDHPGLGAYKGVDEPRNPFRGANWIRPEGLVRALRRLKALDPNHPLVIIQAPRSTVAQLTPYRPAFDITGADIFPIAYPPGEHSDLGNRDLSVVGDVTRKMVRAAGGKPVWTTLQIAWSGTVTSVRKPNVVPRFPTLHELRFMAYQAIASGARGLMFFGGHLTQTSRPVDARAGWNWTFWELALRPLLQELSSTAVAPALVAPAGPSVKASAQDFDLVTRRDGRFLYVIAARRGGATSRVGFTGLPRKLDGSALTGGQVLFEYVQEPPPPPIGAGRQVFRSVSVANGGFRDWFGPHDVHVYRFGL